jgi:quercetin dioxygenase-like cupin family protein
MVRGDTAQLRVWDREPAGEVAPEHANDYEYLAYVVEGRMRVPIANGVPIEVGAGDSYRIPAGTPYAFEVLAPATVVEAVTGEGPGTRHSRERPFTADDAAGADEGSSG